MGKVIARVFGGMGNQMFIYAAARRLALENNAELVLDHLSGFKYDHTFNRNFQLHHLNVDFRYATEKEMLEPFSRVRRVIAREKSKLMSFQRRPYLAEEKFGFDPRFLELVIGDEIYLDGYWQSENYFKDIDKVIREDFSLKSSIRSEDHCALEEINNSNSVAVHFRFFDSPSSDGTNDQSFQYYSEAINRLGGVLDNPHFFVFSNDADFVRKKFKFPNDKFTIINHNHGDQYAYADLYLMSQCNHFVIPRSTFSWWAAWIGKCPKKMVIMPKYTPPGKLEWSSMGMVFSNAVSV